MIDLRADVVHSQVVTDYVDGYTKKNALDKYITHGKLAVEPYRLVNTSPHMYVVYALFAIHTHMCALTKPLPMDARGYTVVLCPAHPLQASTS